MFLSADGDAEDGAFGGQGQGGLARVDAYDGASLSAASLTVQALGEGGNGTVFAGSGDGGTAQVRAHSGASITTGNLTVDASATGGDSVTGGDAFGGDAEASALEDGSQLTVTGLATVKANGTGGTGTIAGAGGSGFGGSAALYSGSVTRCRRRDGHDQQCVGAGQRHRRSGGTGGSGFGGGDPSKPRASRSAARHLHGRER